MYERLQIRLVECINACFRIKGRLAGGRSTNILEAVMLPMANESFPNQNFHLHQDKCPAHTCKYVNNWLVENDINMVDWNAKSPALNSLENLWGLPLNSWEFWSPNRNELWEAIQQVWQEVDVEIIKNIILSKKRGLQIVLNRRGAAVKY